LSAGDLRGSLARSTDNLRGGVLSAESEDIFRQVVESEGKAVLEGGGGRTLAGGLVGKECVVEEADGQKNRWSTPVPTAWLVPATTAGGEGPGRATVKRKRRAQRARKGVKRARLSAVKLGADNATSSCI